MEYQTFNPNVHDSRKIAELIYDVDFRTFDYLFSTKQKAILAIERSLKEDECLKVIVDNGEIIGILRFYTFEKKSKANLNSPKLLIVNILDYFVTCDIKMGDFYVAEIAIDQKHRSKGYGTKVLNDIISYASENNYRRVTLDADFRNPKAKALYEKLGFKVFNKKSFLKRGMYNMEFNIS